MKTNKDLELYIDKLRMDIGQRAFDSDELINAYFLSAILLFNNLKKVKWIDKPLVDNYNDYFFSKMDFKFDGNPQNAINSLLQLWNDKNVTSIEYNLRGLQFLLHEIKSDFSEEILDKVVEYLKPLKIISSTNKESITNELF